MRVIRISTASQYHKIHHRSLYKRGISVSNHHPRRELSPLIFPHLVLNQKHAYSLVFYRRNAQSACKEVFPRSWRYYSTHTDCSWSSTHLILPPYSLPPSSALDSLIRWSNSLPQVQVILPDPEGDHLRANIGIPPLVTGEIVHHLQ